MFSRFNDRPAAMAEKMPIAFYQGEPRVPGWVTKLAGQASE